MEIKIDLSEEAIDKLLKVKGYTVEEVSIHYPKFHYTSEDKYGKFMKRIAYPTNDRPKVLDNEIIKSTDVNGMDYQTVINKLFNEMLIEKLLN